MIVKDRIIKFHLATGDSDLESSSKELIGQLDQKLPPHFKFVESDSLKRSVNELKEVKPTYLVILGLTLETYALLLQAIYEGVYEQIILWDKTVHDFNIKGMVNSFVQVSVYRGLFRSGAKEKADIVAKTLNFHIVSRVDEMFPLLNNLDNQINTKKVEDRKTAKKETKVKKDKAKIEQEAKVKAAKEKAIANGGVVGLMDAHLNGAIPSEKPES